ncbi:MAG TPA: adenylate/guanylate cyclase domain-containing protein [Burkholderiaceae bacterium]
MSTVSPSNPETSALPYDPQAGLPVQEHRRHEPLTVLALVLLILGLPVVVWLDLVNLTDASLKRQASDLNAVITAIRGYYGSEVVNRVLSVHSATEVAPNYQDIPGAIPLPATLSLELGRVIGDKQPNISYRFVSDYPFRKRTPHVLDDFETKALASLRQNPSQPAIYRSSTGLRSQVRLISPIVMESACVSCHNSHPDSPKTDWKVGDVRGIQELIVTQPVSLDLSSFFFIFCYLIVASGAGVAFVMMQNRRNDTIRQINHKLRGANDFLASISRKLASYLSPQIYKSIFSGAMDVAIQTKRKKLTIFFSDIKDFTALTEKLQPEEITALINEYFTEMSGIALRYGGTIDKFVGDAILVFFGDPESGGDVADAQACMRMAIDMQHRVSVLNVKWRRLGVEEPFRVRMGINTGFCNVGNFGSADRMDYTILGAEANLAARLQSIAQGGGIVVSYETYALVRDIVSAHALAPTTMKGISREIVPYAIDGLLDSEGHVIQVFAEHATGLDLYLDLGRIDAAQARTLKSVLQKAMDALDKQAPEEDGSTGG